MDPVTFIIVFCATIGGGLLLKGTEVFLSRDKIGAAGSIAIEYTYEQRWSNPEYVEMIHKTMAAEKETEGKVWTECKCKYHEDLKHYKHMAKVAPKSPTSKFVVAGYEFEIDSSVIPPYASATWDSAMQVGIFRWIDPQTGQQHMMKALPKMDMFGAVDIYSDQYAKPIRQIKPKRAGMPCVEKGCSYFVSGNNSYCHLHRKKEPRRVIDNTNIKAGTVTGSKISTGSDHRTDHVIFTKDGMKKVTKNELDDLFRKVREADRKNRELKEKIEHHNKQLEAVMRMGDLNQYNKRY